MSNLVVNRDCSCVNMDQNVLPRILEQITNCKDAIAQEYLMEIIVQVLSSCRGVNWPFMWICVSPLEKLGLHLAHKGSGCVVIWCGGRGDGDVRLGVLRSVVLRAGGGAI